MISFLICLALLIGGYFLYGKVVENTFGPDDRETPAVKINDGVDYVVLPQWKLFMIQLLNIAGLGPIFGALQGALWGPIVFLWITFGTIFAGGVHDYFSGMMSERNNGASISEISGIYLGGFMKNVMRVFSVVLLIMVGTVFAVGPAGLIVTLFKNGGSNGIVTTTLFWLIIVLVYYFIATFLSIDKIIGKDQIAVFHINDSKNPRGAAKDRHENIGLGSIGFDALYKIVWHKDFLDVPKILETPYVKSLADAKKAFPPYKEEIDMLRSGAYDAARITKLAE